MGKTDNLKPSRLRGVRIFTRIMAAVCLATFLFVGVYTVIQYQSVAAAYRRGDYTEVSGIVTDFHPMPASGHDYESFTLGGTSFAYSDYEMTIGYHHAASLGGIITGNGQELTIRYVEDGWDKHIVYIASRE